MNKILLLITVLTQLLLCPTIGYAQDKKQLCFMENEGQIVDQYGRLRSDIDFSISSQGFTVFVGDGQIHYQWHRYSDEGLYSLQDWHQNDRDEALNKSKNGGYVETRRMDVLLLNANTTAQLLKSEPLGYYERYFSPYCGPEGCLSFGYRKMTYKNIYPNIDWVIYIKGLEVEYDFILHPGARISDIQLQYNGAEQLAIQADGSFLAKTEMGNISESAPYSFQADGTLVNSSFILEGSVLGFKADSYEDVLTIDPKILWATYYGGDGEWDFFQGSHIDASSNFYVVGQTTSFNNIATVGAFKDTISGLGISDAMLVKFNKDGVRQWSTYYGGSGTESAYSVVTDTSGYVYMGGVSSGVQAQSVIATTGAHQDNYGGGLSDAYLVKFDSTGKRIWGTYFGGEATDGDPNIVYSNGHIYLTGVTQSKTGISTPGSHKSYIAQRSASITMADVYLAKFDSDGNRIWSTYFGGKQAEGSSVSIATSGKNEIYISSSTRSLSAEDSITTANAHKYLGTGPSDYFLAKFDESGSLTWSTYFGGEDSENANEFNSLGCDSLGNVYMAGRTTSKTGIASLGAAQGNLGGSGDIFLAKFDNKGNWQWGTYIGGSRNDEFPSIALSKDNKIYISGTTRSKDGIATSDALQSILADTVAANSANIDHTFFNDDAFFVIFDTVGNKLYGSYFGGPASEHASCIAVDVSGDAYLAGSTNSITGIATSGSHQDTFPDRTPRVTTLRDGYVAKFCLGSSIYHSLFQGGDSICAYSSQTYTAAANTDIDAYLWLVPEGWTDAVSGHTIDIQNDGNSGIISLQVVRCGDTSTVYRKMIYVYPPLQPLITIDGFELHTERDYKRYQWLHNDTAIPGATGQTYTVSANGFYQVVVENELGCIDTSDEYEITNVDINSLNYQVSLQIYPNPTNSLLYVQSNQQMSLSLRSIHGHELLRTQGRQIDMSVLNPGVYFLYVYDVKTGRWVHREKVVKVHMQ